MTTGKHARITTMIGIGVLAIGLGACGEQKSSPATTTEVVTETATPSASDAGTTTEASSPADQSSEATSSAPSDKPEPTASDSAQPSDQPRPSGGTSEGTPTCTIDQLTLTTTRGDSAAGHTMQVLTFTNKGKTCRLSGHPSIFAVGGGNGTVIGKGAAWSGDAGTHPVTLTANGGKAQIKLEMTNIGTNGGPLGDRCKPVPADGLRVYPPDLKKAMYVKVDSMYACSTKVDWMFHGRVAEA